MDYLDYYFNCWLNKSVPSNARKRVCKQMEKIRVERATVVEQMRLWAKEYGLDYDTLCLCSPFMWENERKHFMCAIKMYVYAFLGAGIGDNRKLDLHSENLLALLYRKDTQQFWRDGAKYLCPLVPVLYGLTLQIWNMRNESDREKCIKVLRMIGEIANHLIPYYDKTSTAPIILSKFATHKEAKRYQVDGTALGLKDNATARFILCLL